MFFLKKFNKYFFFLIAALTLIGLSSNLNHKVKAVDFAATTITATNQTSSQIGGVIRECWLGIGGNNISNIPLNSPPSFTDYLTSLEAPSNWADNYGTRIRGYITAPQTGSYRFWIASDDEGEFWLSATDQPANKTRIAFVGGYTQPREWGKLSSQKSASINLVAGQNYYFEVLHKDGARGDNLAVGWSKPGQNTAAPSEIVPGSVLSPLANPSSEQARRADDFIDSIGVNTHLSYTGNIYQNFNSIIKPRLGELGVRHIRDGLEPRRLDTDAKLKDLYNSFGIKSLLIMNPTHHTPSEALNYVKNTLGAGKVSAIEGMNEPNNFIGGCCWAETTRNFQRQMFQAFRSDAATANIPFIAPSIVILDPQASAARELGDLSAHTNFGNVHNYYSGRNPETSGWGSNGYGSLAFSLNFATPPVSGSQPIWSTETGYHNASSTTSGHRYTPENVAARYLPRLFLYQFNQGVKRTYPYELIDENTNLSDQEHNFGLLRYNNTAKPAFNALKNLIALLRDPGASFATDALDYTLSGETTDLQHTLLQKRDGTFYLVLWIGSQRWQPDSRVETNIPNQRITLNLNSQITLARTYLPLNGTNAIGNYSNPAQITLSVPDHPLIIELKPNGLTSSDVIENGVYRLSVECSGKTLDVKGANRENGAKVQQWAGHGGENQQWRVERLSNGDYQLMATHSGKLLDVSGAATNDGADVGQWSATGGANQRWRIVSVGAGFYKLLPQNASGKALDVSGASLQNGAKVQIWTDNGTSAQRWKLEFIKP